MISVTSDVVTERAPRHAFVVNFIGLKVNVCLSLLLALAACRYDARSIDFDGGDTMPTDTDDGSVGPTAIIRSVEADTGILNVPSTGTVTFSGADSVADGTHYITDFAWAPDGCFAGADSALLGASTLSIEASRLTDGCVATLTVTDDLGRTDSATATIGMRLVGGYISQRSPCQAEYDPALTTGQGTETNPFCSLDAALDAAAVVAIGELRFDSTEVIVFKHAYDLPALRYSGAYTRDIPSQSWSAGSGITRVRAELTDINVPMVRMADNGDYVITDFQLARSQRCDSDCTSVLITGAHVTLDRVTLPRVGSSAFANPSEGATTVIAVTGSVGRPARLDGTGLIVRGDASLTTGTGISVRGDATIALAGAIIESGTGGQFAYGIRAGGGATVRLSGNSSVFMLGNPTDVDGVMYGIAAGRTELLPGLDDCTVGQAVCAAAAEVTLDTSSAVVSNARFASALAVVGSTVVTTTGGALNAMGGAAEAVHTIGVTSLTMNGTSMRSFWQPGSSANPAYSVALSDGSGNATDGFSLGAGRLTLEACDVIADVTDTLNASIERIVALELKGTAGGAVHNTAITVYGGTNNLLTANEVIGAALYATAGMTFATEGPVKSFRIERSITARTINAPFRDGVIGRDNLGSRNLTVSGYLFDSKLDGTLQTTQRACLVLAATTDSLVSGGQISCGVPTASLVSSVAQYTIGLWTLGTTRLTVDRLVIDYGNGFTSGAPSNSNTWVVGVLDGALPGSGFGTLFASSELVLQRLQMEIDNTGQVHDVGIWVREYSAARIRPRILNGRLIVSATGSSNAHGIGIALEKADAQIAFNTIRYGRCASPPCLGSGVAIETVNGDGRNVELRANVLTTQSRSESDHYAPAILEVGGATTFGFASLANNLWGGDGNGVSDAHELYHRHAPLNDGTILESPTEVDSNYDPAVLGPRVTANLPTNPIFCGAGFSKIASNTSNPNTIDTMTLASSLLEALTPDGDGDNRAPPSYDAGATEWNCPP